MQTVVLQPPCNTSSCTHSPTWLYERDQELSNGVGKPPVDRYLLFYRHDQVRLPPQLWIARFPLHYREPQDTP